VGSPIAYTDDDHLYQSERYANGNWQYRFDVPNGNYDVSLRFAEIYNPDCFPNKRKFNINIQGIPVLSNFDIFAETGCTTAVIKNFYPSVTNGNLIIDLIKIPGFDTPEINAIQIAQIPSITTPTASPTSTPTLTPTPSSTPIPTPTLNPNPTPTSNPTVIYRVNTGGPAFIDANGLYYLADKQYKSGSWGYVESGTSTYVNASAVIKNASGIPVADQTLYQTERYKGAAYSYRFDVPNGLYQVTLKFAEIYPPTCNLGARIFNVIIENNPALTNFDIFRSSSSICYTTVDQSFNTEVKDGNLTINFTPVTNAPAIQGIIIVKK